MSKIDQAREVAAKLNAVTDELNDVLRKAEYALVAAKLGVTGELEIGEGRGLAFTKIDDAWGLYVYRPGGHVTPLLKANRMERVDAARHLGALLDVLIFEVEGEATNIDEALSAAVSFVEMMAADSVGNAPESQEKNR